ncbi:MAG: WD40/YVTN/BNR-like repeat-containing protein [Candidatus Heimdallarchaeota archaeon]
MDMSGRIMPFQIETRKSRPIALVAIFVLVWATIFLGLTFLRFPFMVYLEGVPTGWRPINIATYPATGVTALDFGDSFHGWIGGEDGLIMATTDGGLSWAPQHSGINSSIQAMDFFNADVGTVVSKRAEILITRDGGLSWILLDDKRAPDGWWGTYLWDVVTTDENTAWVLGTRTFFRINITNQSWNFVSNVSLALLDFTMVNNTHGWASGGFGNIIRTTTGWQSYEVQDAGVSTNFRDIFFWDDHRGWVVGYENSIFGTTDGGDHWVLQYRYRPFIPLEVPNALLDIEFISESKGWAVGYYGIHVTENGGATWTPLPDSSGPSSISFANETHGWAVGYRKEWSFRTTTGGASFISENTINSVVGVLTFVPLVVLPLIFVYRDYKKHQRWLMQDNNKN